MIGEEFLWVEKYRPRTVEDCILPARIKEKFQAIVDKGEIPDTTLSGGAGVGKTTLARAMCNQIGADYMFINGSMNGNIDTLRVEIQQFASSVSLMGGRKYVILDEADHLNPNSTQPALRGFIEEFSKNCGFILTCNFPYKIIEPLHSRAPIEVIDIKKSEKGKMASQFHKRAMMILDEENIQYDPKVVAELIMKYMPDWRRVLGILQRYSAGGTIDSGILVSINEQTFNSLLDNMKHKRFSEVRKWVGENSDIDSSTLFRELYDNAVKRFDVSSIPPLVYHLAKYQYQAAFVADPEINIAACLLEIMSDCNFKD